MRNGHAATGRKRIGILRAQADAEARLDYAIRDLLALRETTGDVVYDREAITVLVLDAVEDELDERGAEVAFEVGDTVTWRFRGRAIRGTIERKLTTTTEVQGRRVAASVTEPRYLVRSAVTGRETIRRGSSIQRG